MRRFEFLVGEPGALGPEHDRRGRAVRLGHDAYGRIAYIDDPEVLIAIARGGRRHEAAAIQRLAERAHDARSGEYVVRPGGARGRVRMRELLRSHEQQLAEG